MRSLVILTVALGTAFAAGPAAAGQVGVQAQLGHRVLRTGAKQTEYLRVALTGFAMPVGGARAPLNVAIVIDKSSSMAGEKIRRAKEAALAALDELEPRDILSVVAYDSAVSVLVPATRVSDRRTIVRGINRLRPRGMTALFGGTSKGAAEVRKFLARGQVNRVILLSDGQANVGPSSPADLAALGASLGREGIAVTTVGLGLDYNEDLMAALASRSGGNHLFAEHASDLVRVFRRGFGGLARIVAQEVVVKVRFAEGFRPVRTLGLSGQIVGREVVTNLAQLYSGEVGEVVIELEIPQVESMVGQVATVEVTYHDLLADRVGREHAEVRALFSPDADQVEASVERSVMVPVIELLATERNEQALRLRDQGRTEEARDVLDGNARFLEKNALSLDSTALRNLQSANESDRDNLSGSEWKRQRKVMKHRSRKYKARMDEAF